jgi:hypothetical protein
MASHIVPAPIVGDNTAALLAFFASVPDGSEVRFPYRREYQSDATLLLENKTGLTVYQNEAVFYSDVVGPLNRQGLSDRHHVRLFSCADVIWHQLLVRGPNPESKYIPAYEGERGISIAKSQRIQLIAPEISNVYGDFVSFREVTDALVDSLIGRIAGRQGVAWSGDEVNTEVRHSDLRGIGRSAFDIEPNAPELVNRGTRIYRNRIEDFKNYWLALANNAQKHDLYVGYNEVVGKPIKPAIGGDPAKNRWTNHVYEFNTSATLTPGIQVAADIPIWRYRNLDGLRIRGNVQPFRTTDKFGRSLAPSTTRAVVLDGCTDAKVGDNVFIDCQTPVPAEFDDGGNVYA